MITRSLFHKLLNAKKSVLILGPRQVGKTTLINSLPHDFKLNLASETEFLKHSTDADLLPSLIKENKYKKIFIDEVQRIPTLLNTIQEIIDSSKQTKKPIQFYLSGSSARKLKRGQANLLPGRIFSYRMLGLSLEELEKSRKTINWEKCLKIGFLPETLLSSLKNAEKLLSTYSATYLKEEVQAEALTRNLQGFSRFLKEISEKAGQILDFSKLSNESKISRTTCIRFMEILEDTMIAQALPVFKGAAHADIVKHPKIFFFDVGVLNGLLENFEASGDRKGMLNEHAIYNQIKNTAAAKDKAIKLYYFRTRHGLEVDFILELNNKIWAIEVKSKSISRSDIKPLFEFKKYYPKTHRLVIVSPKETKRSIDGVLICNPFELLKELNW